MDCYDRNRSNFLIFNLTLIEKSYVFETYINAIEYIIYND